MKLRFGKGFYRKRNKEIVTITLPIYHSMKFPHPHTTKYGNKSKSINNLQLLTGASF